MEACLLFSYKQDNTVKVPLDNEDKSYASRSRSNTRNLNLGMIGQESVTRETGTIARR